MKMRQFQNLPMKMAILTLVVGLIFPAFFQCPQAEASLKKGLVHAHPGMQGHVQAMAEKVSLPEAACCHGSQTGHVLCLLSAKSGDDPILVLVVNDGFVAALPESGRITILPGVNPKALPDAIIPPLSLYSLQTLVSQKTLLLN